MAANVRAPLVSCYRTDTMLCRITSLAMLVLLAVHPIHGQTTPPESPAEAKVSDQAAAEQPDALVASEYTGPAVLSRGNQPALGQEAVFTTIQPFFYVNQIYDTGLSVMTGGIASPSMGVAGVESGFGIRGTHRWRRIILNVNYEGNYRQYTQQTGLAGMNQYLRATEMITLKRHLELALRQTVASVVQDVGSLSLQPLQLSETIPTSEPFDNRARLFDTQATLTYQKSRRLSFTSSVESSRIERDLAPLVGTNQTVVSGDVGYLLSSHATIGADYSFSHFGYTTFGSANLSTVSGNLSWRLTRTVDVALQFGMSEGGLTTLAIVPLDPAVSALVGIQGGLQILHQMITAPALHGRISKRWHYVSIEATYQKGISPGNGLVLTSNSTAITGGLHYTPSRLWTLSVQAGRTTMEGLAGVMGGTYSSYVTNISLARIIRPTVQLVARFDARPFSYLGAGLQTRTFYRTSIGFTYSPREMPVVFR